MIDEPPALEGAINFRDLGGLATTDGRRVRRGLVYRSGSMHGLTAADQRVMAELGIRTVFDLRSNPERNKYPLATSDEWPPFHWSRDHLHGTGNIEALRRMPGAGREEARQRMLHLYQVIPYDHSDSYRELFTRLADGEVPLVFNCAAGKDRTGVAAILLLDALGVARDAILADYLASNAASEQIWQRYGRGDNWSDERERWAPLFCCDADYAAALFARLESEHGGPAGYRRDVLGLDAAAEQRLRDRLLSDEGS